MFDNYQKQALSGIVNWYFKENKQVCVLSGEAGTGKTFLIKQISDSLIAGLKSTRIAYCAYTAKAAMVLKSKGVLEASTIHSLIYEAHHVIDEAGNKNVKFIRRKFINYDLIIIDEASMVDEKIFKDISNFGKKILCVGDAYQLPPIGDKFNLLDEKNVNYWLKEIHRQGEGSEIIDIAHQVKNGKKIDYFVGDRVKKIKLDELTSEELVGYDQIICGKNKNRIIYNKLYRSIKGYDDKPQKNEKIVFLKNNCKLGVFNGQQAYLSRDVQSVGKNKCRIYYKDMSLEFLDLLVAEELSKLASMICLEDEKYSETILKDKNNKNGELVYFDYAYVMTVHKAQGSQYDNVLLVDDKFGIWNDDLRRRFLYTAITRASYDLTIVD